MAVFRARSQMTAPSPLQVRPRPARPLGSTPTTMRLRMKQLLPVGLLVAVAGSVLYKDRFLQEFYPVADSFNHPVNSNSTRNITSNIASNNGTSNSSNTDSFTYPINSNISRNSTSNSTRNSTSNSSNTSKPMLILHVGPMKTGTTAIQTSILTNKKILKALEQDNIGCTLGHINFRYVGKLSRECLSQPINSTHCKRQDLWDRFQDEMTNARFGADNKVLNVLNSVESYSGLPDNDYTIGKLLSLKQIYDVHVIAFFRRHVGWLRSMYKQSHKGKMFRSGRSKFKGYDAGLDLDLQTYQPASRDTLDVVEYYGRVFGKDKIHVGDFYADDLAEEFICNAIPITTPTACKYVRDNRKTYSGLNNDNFLFDEDLVVMEAYRQGYLKKDGPKKFIDRHKATKKLKSLFDTNGTRDTLPKKCIDAKRFDWFWNRTLVMEQTLAPNPLSSEVLWINFENETSKLCALDEKAIVEQPEWKQVFSSCAFQIQAEGSVPCNVTIG